MVESREKPAGGSSAVKPRLLDVVRQAVRTRHYSRRTEEAYVGWIRRFILFHHKRHPADMGEREIVQFLSDLATGRGVSASTQNQAASALLFLYCAVLQRPSGSLGEVVRARRPERLPLVLTPTEVGAVLGCLHGTPKLMASLLYGSGLRLLECAELRVKDLDFERKAIVVRDGKGQKDRVTVLPDALERPLMDHLAGVKRLHETDLRAGAGCVALPDALAHKYPRAPWEWGWQ